MIDLKNSDCQKCGLCKFRKYVVNGYGPTTTAKIVLVGEAPGSDENNIGIPFVGKAGKLLDKILFKVGINRKEVFITNSIRCIPKAPPPQNVREPEPDELIACSEYLEKELLEIKPNVIVPMGNTALRVILGQRGVNITKKRGIEIWSEKYNCKVIPTFHPAAILRNPQHEGITIQDFQRIKLASESKEVAKKNIGQYTTIDTLELLDSLVEKLLNVDAFAYDIETTSLDWKTGKILCIAFTWKEGTGCVVPLTRYSGRPEEHTEIKERKVRKKVDGVWIQSEPKKVEVKKTVIVDEYFPYWEDKQAIVLEKLRTILKSDVKKIAHNGKFDVKFLIKNNLPVNNFYFDTMLAHHLIDENAVNSHGLKECTWVYTDMGGYDQPIEDWFKEKRIPEKKRNYAHLPADLLYKYNCMDTDATFRLFLQFEPKLEQEHVDGLFFRLIMPLTKTLTQAEIDGVQIDIDYLAKLKIDLSESLQKIEKEIKMKVGDDKFNLNSTPQLRKLLFDDLKLPSLKQTKKNQDATDEEVLIELAKMHEIPKMILDCRKLEKLLGTYISGIEEAMDEEHRIHTTYLIHGTVTGRLASREPNLQNIPRDDLRIKKLFVARPSWKIAEFDYGQAEFRHWANYSQDQKMIADIMMSDASKGVVDIHKLTAASVLGIPVEKVTKPQRQQAKGVVFGLMYGRGAKSLAEEFGISENEANQIIRVFFGKYPQAKKWLEEAIKTVKIHKQIRNVFGRVRRLPGIDSMEGDLRADAERQSLNSPIQSASSDMNNNAANRIYLKLRESNLHGILCLLVHDSLLYEIPENELYETVNIIKNEMERPIEGVSVPMVVEIKVGTRWGELKEIKDEEILERNKVSVS